MPITKVCRACGLDKPLEDYFNTVGGLYGKHSRCKVCQRVAGRKFYQNNRTKRIAYASSWNRNNADRVRELGRARRKRNPEKYRLYCREWWDSHPGARKLARDRWKRNNPDAWKEADFRRRIRRLSVVRGVEGSFTHEEWVGLCNKHDNRCLSCGGVRRLTVDHVIPISKGGSNYIDNIQPLCGPCNSAKKDKYIDFRKVSQIEHIQIFEAPLQGV